MCVCESIVRGSLCVQVCERHVCVTKLRVKEMCAEVCVKELCACVEVCVFKFVKDMCVAKLRVKELCAEVCVKELHVCVCMKALCAEVCVCVSALYQRVLAVYSSKRRGPSFSSLVDGQRRGQ